VNQLVPKRLTRIYRHEFHEWVRIDTNHIGYLFQSRLIHLYCKALLILTTKTKMKFAGQDTPTDSCKFEPIREIRVRICVKFNLLCF